MTRPIVMALLIALTASGAGDTSSIGAPPLIHYHHFPLSRVPYEGRCLEKEVSSDLQQTADNVILRSYSGGAGRADTRALAEANRLLGGIKPVGAVRIDGSPVGEKLTLAVDGGGPRLRDVAIRWFKGAPSLIYSPVRASAPH